LVLENSNSTGSTDIMYPSEEADAEVKNISLRNIFATSWRGKTSTGYG
jgi:hypothetical protein